MIRQGIEPLFTESNKNSNDHRINLRKIYSRIAKYWPSVLICVIVSMLFAFAYLRYATSQYLVSSRILIKTDKNNSGNGALLSELGMNPGTNNVENEVEILKSRILMQQVVSQMHLNVNYYIPGNIKITSLYREAPFTFIPLYPDSIINATIKYDLIKLSDGSMKLSSNGKNITARLGDTVVLDNKKLVIETNPYADDEYKSIETFTVEVGPLEPAIDAYQAALTVEMANKQVNIITLSIKDVLPERGKDVLSNLINAYRNANINDKTEVANGTIEFIDNRLSLVNQELTGVEKDIQGFKSRNRFTDVNAQSKMLLDNTSTNEKELTGKEVQLRILESLENYLKDNNNARRVMPATLIAQDATLTGIIEEYNGLQMQRQKLLLTYTENSPQVRNTDEAINDTRVGMRSYIASLKSGYKVAVNELRSRAGSIDAAISKVPENERIYLEYSRKQQIKQELYLFLLQKREESAISKSATVSNLKVIDPPKTSGKVSPVKSRIYLIAFALGIIVPGARILIRELLNDRIENNADILALTQMPIIAEIGHHPGEEIIAVRKDSRTVVSEQFRALRTNLQFLLPRKEQKIIMLTSSMSGEGKSFVSVNLACALAISGKKVVLLELDLRKPQVTKKLGISNAVGFSNYIVGQASLDAILNQSPVSEQLYVIPSGPLPPNPSELLMLPQVNVLMDALKENFDYIIIDTAPVGLVTDAQLLSAHTDATLFVVRQGYTHKEQIKAADALYRSDKISKMSLVVNDVDSKHSSNYGYATYGSGYYDDETVKTGLAKYIKRKN